MVGGVIRKVPEDVVINVLIRFPVKSLIRFKCVSKNLCILIRSAIFTNIHLSRTTTTQDEFILLKRSLKKDPERFKNVLSFLVGVDNGAFNHVLPNLDVPHLVTDYGSIFHQLIGPCHGLIALTDSNITVLLNPTTKTYRLLPPCPFGCPKGYHRTIEGVGFGFVSILNDFKVVRISDVFWDPPYGYPEGRDSKVDVYELSTDCWRELEPVQVPRVYWLPCSEMFYKEAVHWFATTDKVVIICFDIGTEIFRNMKMPDACYYIKQSRYGLLVLSESLTLICYHDPGCIIDPTQDFIYIWIMKEYGVSGSWIKKYTIRSLPIESPLVVWKGHLLLLQTETGHLISYDINSDEINEFDLHGFPKSLRVVVYTESLTLIPSGSKHDTRVQNF